MIQKLMVLYNLVSEIKESTQFQGEEAHGSMIWFLLTSLWYYPYLFWTLLSRHTNYFPLNLPYSLASYLVNKTTSLSEIVSHHILPPSSYFLADFLLDVVSFPLICLQIWVAPLLFYFYINQHSAWNMVNAQKILSNEWLLLPS